MASLWLDWRFWFGILIVCLTILGIWLDSSGYWKPSDYPAWMHDQIDTDEMPRVEYFGDYQRRHDQEPDPVG